MMITIPSLTTHSNTHTPHHTQALLIPNDVNSSITQALVFLVSQRLGRCNGYTVTSVHTHGVHVFNGADNDYVVVHVTHHLQLILLPTQQALLHQDLCVCVGGGYVVKWGVARGRRDTT